MGYPNLLYLPPLCASAFCSDQLFLWSYSLRWISYWISYHIAYIFSFIHFNHELSWAELWILVLWLARRTSSNHIASYQDFISCSQGGNQTDLRQSCRTSIIWDGAHREIFLHRITAQRSFIAHLWTKQKTAVQNKHKHWKKMAFPEMKQCRITSIYLSIYQSIYCSSGFLIHENSKEQYLFEIEILHNRLKIFRHTITFDQFYASLLINIFFF